jgi:chemotaxis protein methyltransferase CheR
MTRTAASRETNQYVTLGIDREVFAVEVAVVKEILDMRPISWVPNAPPFMLGMIDVRGAAVPVIDLRLKLGLPAAPPTEHTRIIVLETPLGGRVRLLGLVADRVFEVTPLAEQDQEPPPEVGVRCRACSPARRRPWSRRGRDTMEVRLSDTADRLSRRNFQRLARFIEDYSGIRMPEAKQTMVEGRLRRRAVAQGHASLDEYCERLFEGDGLRHEVVELIDAITTNKTEFFREGDHFQLLADKVLPQVMAWPDRPGLDRPLVVWSAASSIGAEPYTIAMVLDQVAERVRGLRCRILATDICTDVLAKAKLAVYPEEMLAPVPQPLRRRYFLRSRDADRPTVRLVPRIRRMVEFGRLNLMDEEYGIDDVDIVFCRNILIYFDKARQQAVLRRICRHLRPGGYLFVGHSETVTGLDLPVKPVATALFRKE